MEIKTETIGIFSLIVTLLMVLGTLHFLDLTLNPEQDIIADSGGMLGLDYWVQLYNAVWVFHVSAPYKLLWQLLLALNRQFSLF